MDWFSYIASGLGVYVALTVFTLGMAWRIWEWARTPKTAVRLALYPKPTTRVGRLGKLLKDTFVAPQSVAIAAGVMIAAFAFHIAALAAFVGHLRLVREFTPLVELLGTEGMSTFAAWSGKTAGSIMFVAVLYWIARRTFGAYRKLSTPEDYFLLALLFGIVIMGNHMRFFGHVEASVYQEWFASVLAFRPSFPAELADSPTRHVLNWHMIFVNAFLIYFPFSKMTHAVGAFATNLVRSSE